jgi:hypothetical protein
MNLNNEFLNNCKKHGNGTILEFGTFSGFSAKWIAERWKPSNGKLITIDGWKGLPKSEKTLPSNGVWKEGAFTGNKDKVAKDLSIFENVEMVDSWINQLAAPKKYKVGTVVGANIDVDIYESTMDSLLWLDKCEWLNNEVIVRFDDWDHPGTPKFRNEVAQHNKLAWTDFLTKTGYKSEKLSEDAFASVFKLSK